MNDYVSSNSHNVFSKDTGLGWVSRLSTISVSRAQPIDWHAHGGIEVLVCHHGAPTYEFEGRPPITLHPGSFLVIPPRRRHRLLDGIDGHQSRSSIFLAVPGRRNRITGFFSTAEYRNAVSFLLAKRLRPGRLPAERKQDLSRLSALIAKGEAMSELERLELRALTVTTVISIASRQSSPEDKPMSENVIDDAMSWIERRLDRKFSIRELLAYIGYGRSRFFTLFREKTGLSPVEWTTQCRIEKAKRMLSDEGASITDAARASGFRSVAFFSKTFKTHVGATPSEWRARRRTSLDLD